MLNGAVDTKEVSVASQLPYSQQISPTLVITNPADLTSTIQVHGISFDTMTNAEIDGLNRTWLSTINSVLSTPNNAVWTHIVRTKRKNVIPECEYDNSFSETFMSEYNKKLEETDFLANRLYLSPVYRIGGTKTDRKMMKLQSRKSEDFQAQRDQAQEMQERFLSTLKSSVRRYHPRVLEAYDNKNGGLNTEIGELYAALLNHQDSEISLERANLSQTLQRAHIDFGHETIRIVNGAHTTYAAILTMVSPYTTEAINAKVHEPLLKLPFELVLSQSFTTMPQDEAERKLKAQLNRIRSAGANEIQITDVENALEQLQANKYKMLEHEWILVIYGDSPKQLNNNVNDAIEALAPKSIQLSRESNGPLIATYFSMFPAAFQHGRIRARPISSLNMAKFFPMHNFPSGNREGSQWGKPLIVLSTNSHNPYYVNFHVSRDRLKEQGVELGKQIEEDDESDEMSDSTKRKSHRKELGNYYVIGEAGSGKTTLKGALRAASKRKGKGDREIKIFAFDKDFGEEILMRAMGARYFVLEPGQPSGMNPFQWEDTVETRELVFELAKWAASHDSQYKMTDTDQRELKRAIADVFEYDRKDRRFGHLMHTLPSHQADGSLYHSLARWCYDVNDPKGNQYAWVLDSPFDRMNLNDATAFGFDITALIKMPAGLTPIMRMVTEKILRAAAGSPHIIDIAEAWATLNDPLVGKFIEDKSRTIRKQDGVIGLDTQNAEDITSSSLGVQFLNQFPTAFILPNPKAKEEAYIGGLNLTPREFEIVKSARANEEVLVKKGQESILARLNLTGMNDMLSVLSSSTDNVMICREVIKEYGNDPKVWLPQFYKRRI